MEPNPLAIFVLCLGGAGVLIILLWLNHKLRAPSKSEEEETRAPIDSRPIEETPATVRPSLASLIMSYVFGRVGPVGLDGTEQRSYGVERSAERPGTQAAEPVPSLVEQLATLDDDALLDVLALLPGADDDYRFAESRIAKFIPGRVEDRLTQVRDIRGTQKPPAPGRQLRIRDASGERLISIR